ncbi:MAG: hypothetical protein IPQ19_17345 [Bacteroidetes bacterium]|nr:hypothetical protein [Bacteroidota bacterium]
MELVLWSILLIFRNYLPAITIIPDGTSGNVMAQMNLTNTNSNILLYYHTDKTDSLVRTFPAKFIYI